MTERHADARRFFVAKVVAQAEYEGVALSASEREMLEWSEVEPGSVANPAVAEALAGEMSDQAYETKICHLLDAAYQRDIAGERGAKNAYREAYTALREGDYYLIVMIEQTLGRRLRPWWHFSIS